VNFAFTEFSEVRSHSPTQLPYGCSDPLASVQIIPPVRIMAPPQTKPIRLMQLVRAFCAKFSPNSQKCCGNQWICRKRDAQTLKIHRGFIARWYTSPEGDPLGKRDAENRWIR
jgi:hypothetical protein